MCLCTILFSAIETGSARYVELGSCVCPNVDCIMPKFSRYVCLEITAKCRIFIIET